MVFSDLQWVCMKARGGGGWNDVCVYNPRFWQKASHVSNPSPSSPSFYNLHAVHWGQLHQQGCTAAKRWGRVQLVRKNKTRYVGRPNTPPQSDSLSNLYISAPEGRVLPQPDHRHSHLRLGTRMSPTRGRSDSWLSWKTSPKFRLAAHCTHRKDAVLICEYATWVSWGATYYAEGT